MFTILFLRKNILDYIKFHKICFTGGHHSIRKKRFECGQDFLKFLETKLMNPIKMEYYDFSAIKEK